MPVSLEEKRQRLLHLLHTKREPMHLSELEKIGSRQLKIPPMAIKDVMMQLVYDELVCLEKLGASSFFWSFPGARAAKVRHETAQAIMCDMCRPRRREDRLVRLMDGPHRLAAMSCRWLPHARRLPWAHVGQGKDSTPASPIA